MVRAGLIEIEEAEFEKNGEVLRFRKVLLTETGLEVRPTTPLPLLIGDGIVDEFDAGSAQPPRKKKAQTVTRAAREKPAGMKPDSAPADAACEALAGAAPGVADRRSQAAGRSGFRGSARPHVERRRAASGRRIRTQLLAIDGIGPAKAERFGEAILKLCAASSRLTRSMTTDSSTTGLCGLSCALRGTSEILVTISWPSTTSPKMV